MNIDTTTQSSNDVGGDLAGRDMFKHTFTLNTAHQVSTYINKLYAKLADETASNPSLQASIEDFDYFNSQVDDDQIIGLERKLIEGKRVNMVRYAKDVKERYHKKLLRTCQFSEVSQRINVHLLAKVRSYYMDEVYPSVCEGAEPVYIGRLINERIIKPLEAELGENLLDYTSEDIQGMLYFLTGNCHIKWTL